MSKNKEYNYLKEQFANPDGRFRLVVFFDAKQKDASTDAANFVRSCEAQDVGWVIPRISEDRKLDPGELEHFRHTYAAMLEAAREKKLNIIFNLEGAIEDALVLEETERGESKMRAKVLNRREFRCSPNEDVEIKLQKEGDIMSVVAVNEYDGDMKDLRKYVSDRVLRWHVPDGNWNVYSFVCVNETSRNYVNVLNYDSSLAFIEKAYGLFDDIFKKYVAKELDAIAYSNVCFATKNRRDWDPDFNSVFEKEYGFDPAPYYPMLFSSGNNEYTHIKALMFDCRARMLSNGMIKAFHDFATKKKLNIMGSIAEPKRRSGAFA